MNRPDRREEFKDVPWQQGRLLLTNNTRRWSREQRDEADGIERCIAFAHFSAQDEGRSREYVYQFESQQECAKAVAAHNEAMLKAVIKGVRVDGDKVIIAVKGGNDAARWLCGELLAMLDTAPGTRC